MLSWEWQADEWLDWARTPGHDSYWHYRDLFLDAIVPDPGQWTLDVGCGEGRVARDLARLGHRVVAEATRVLRPGGHLCICITHPTAEAGKFQSKEPDAPFVIAGSYLGRHRVDDHFERGGLQITFTGWRYALEEYARALEDAGLLIERLREPAAPPAALAARPGYERWQRLPSFLHLRAVKPA